MMLLKIIATVIVAFSIAGGIVNLNGTANRVINTALMGVVLCAIWATP